MSESELTTYQCRHIHTAGHRCGSPALRNEPFCYFHHANREPAYHRHADRQNQKLYDRAQQSLPTFELPLPDDHAAIQLSIGQILQRLAANTIEPKRAGLILYALQIASMNLPKPQKNAAPIPTVDEIEEHPTHGTLAPPCEFQSAPHELTLEEILDKQWAQDKIDAAERAIQAEARTPLPILQASTDQLTQPNQDDLTDPAPRTQSKQPQQTESDRPSNYQLINHPFILSQATPPNAAMTTHLTALSSQLIAYSSGTTPPPGCRAAVLR